MTDKDNIQEMKFEIHIPDVIAHRGFSAENPENTLISYETAVKSGTTALEGDIRLSKDDEIVMMHDLTLNRTSTGLGAVREQNWHGYIDGITTKAEPAQPIPRFNDVLDFLIRPEISEGNKELYMIVDIKFDNPIEILDILKQLLDTYTERYPKLFDQLVIGIWNTEYLKRAKELFSKFRLCFIGVSVPAARAHFIDNVDCLSLPFAALAGNDGQSVIKEAHTKKKRVFTWTINDPEQMKTCVLWQVDGVIGDNVTLMLENVQHAPRSLSSMQEYQAFVATDTYLAPKRRRVYYYLVKKAMQLASWKIIGV
ncbi:PLC-like phosphodiesterase [Parasitella parasitica]|nr:PLC-like phosphodiesterase [Parasitella parasitica]